MKTKNFAINTLWVLLLSLATSCNMLPDEPLFDAPVTPEELPVSGTYNGHDYVDLGLPSGIKWATCNVGAAYPEKYGGYYAWGETEEKENYTLSTYKWCNGSETTITKYCTDSIYGTVDNKTVLDPEDDVAHVKWGGNWRMPTKAELDELRNNCTMTWTTLNGVNGQKVTSKTNGNSIFMPAAGYRYRAGLNSSGSYGHYWSSLLYESYGNNAYYLGISSSGFGWYYDTRCYGFTVRPVWGEWQKYTVSVGTAGSGAVAIKDVDGTSAAIEVGSTVTVVATPDEGYAFDGWYVDGNEEPVSKAVEYTFTVSEDVALVARFRGVSTYAGYEYVDLGLPSGLKWATCNVGATKPEEYGGYYAWGETEEKENYEWSTYKWCNGSETTITKYCTDSDYGIVDNKTVLEPEDDVATVKWGGDWRIPTKAEQDELRNNCTWSWTTLNSVNGYKVTSKTNGNSIFLPAAGIRDGTGLSYSGSYGYYWSGSLNGSYSNDAYYLYFHSGNFDWYYHSRYYGRSVRPVYDELAAIVEKYTVTVNSIGDGNVAIKDKDGTSAEFEAGSTVTVVATPDDGYMFSGWFIDGNETPVSTAAEYTFTVSEDVALTARFRGVSTYAGYEYVDLGLPSGIKWAAYNVGATKPEEYGGYYAWGETEEKSSYEWSTYKWCNGSYTTLTKYCIDKRYGTVDGRMMLDPADDVAHVKWGGGWRMPTFEEQHELMVNCSSQWGYHNNVPGCILTGPNGNTIFFPAAGCKFNSTLSQSTEVCYYWSSSLYDSAQGETEDRGGHQAWYMFMNGNADWSNNDRFCGRSVRPVSK